MHLYLFIFKKGSAKYTGKLYINESDYAVLRAEYQLDEGENLTMLI
jgi:hypothetical protein